VAAKINMKAIFPNAQSLQPIPAPNNIHANISGNINSTTTNIIPPETLPMQNTTNTEAIPASVQPSEVKSSNISVVFYLLGFIIIFLVFIFVYEKLKRK
jgi:hypothetical protein